MQAWVALVLGVAVFCKSQPPSLRPARTESFPQEEEVVVDMPGQHAAFWPGEAGRGRHQTQGAGADQSPAQEVGEQQGEARRIGGRRNPPVWRNTTDCTRWHTWGPKGVAWAGASWRGSEGELGEPEELVNGEADKSLQTSSDVGDTPELTHQSLKG